MKGIVKWFDDEKGYEFIECNGEDILLQCADSSSSINKNASYSIFRGAMVCDSDDW